MGFTNISQTSDFLQNELLQLENGVDTTVATDTPFLDELLGSGKVTESGIKFTWREDTIGTVGESVGEKEVREYGEGQKVARTELDNLTQIFEDGASVSDSANAQSIAGIGTEEIYQTQKATKRCKIKIEKALLLGAKKAEDETSGRQTNGLVNLIGNTVNAADKRLTKNMINEAMRMIFEAGQEGNKRCQMHNTMKERIDELYISSTTGLSQIIQPGVNSVGNYVGSINTIYGTLEIIINRHMPVDTILIYDVDNVELKRHQPLRVEVAPKSGSYIKNTVTGEYGLCYRNKLSGTKIINIDNTAVEV